MAKKKILDAVTNTTTNLTKKYTMKTTTKRCCDCIHFVDTVCGSMCNVLKCNFQIKFPEKAKKTIGDYLQKDTEIKTQLPEKQVKNHIYITEYDNGEIHVELNSKSISVILGLLEYAKINIFADVSKNNRVEKIVK